MSFQPLSKYMGMRVKVTLTEGGYITGVLRGYDIHMNLTLADGELVTEEEKIKFGDIVLRGAAIIAITECKE
ncbi:MAG: LSM domain-containing protein [Candidatus Asgardarchaeia archaeon]